MVVIHVKNNEFDTFLYESSCSSSCDIVVRDLVRIWNVRIRLGQLIGSIRDLANHGPMKSSDKIGIDEIQELSGIVIDKSEFYQMDPSGIRNGNGVSPRLKETIEMVARDAESILAKVRNRFF